MRYNFLFFTLIFFSKSLFAQITINQNDMPIIGDTIRQSNTIVSPLIDYTTTGTNYNWDFTDLIWATQKVDTFKSVASTGSIYNLIFYTLMFPNGANLAGTGIPIDLDTVIQVSDVYSFYRKSSTQYSCLGYGASINGTPLPVKFDNPEILYKFPLVLGNTDSSTSSFGQAVPGLGYFGEIRKRKNLVDGWGTLSTPYGTFQTIRVKSEVLYHDTINYQSVGYGIDRHITEYKWLADNKGLPILTISDNGISTTATYIDSFRVHTIDIPKENFTPGKLEIFPSVTSDKINIFLPNNQLENNLSIWTVEGTKVYNIKLPKDTKQISISMKELSNNAGFFIIKVQNKQGFQQNKIVFQP